MKALADVLHPVSGILAAAGHCECIMTCWHHMRPDPLQPPAFPGAAGVAETGLQGCVEGPARLQSQPGTCFASWGTGAQPDRVQLLVPRSDCRYADHAIWPLRIRNKHMS